MHIGVAALAFLPTESPACTRAVYLGPEGMTVTGRTMDWREDPLTNLYIFPRGTARRGANTDNTVFWTSKYGTLSAAGYDIGITDGMNEAGLVAIGRNLFRETDASGAAALGTPGSDGYGTLLQGYVENSNVNLVEEMAHMITTQRAFEINSNVVSTSDEMMQTTTNMV